VNKFFAGESSISSSLLSEKMKMRRKQRSEHVGAKEIIAVIFTKTLDIYF